MRDSRIMFLSFSMSMCVYVCVRGLGAASHLILHVLLGELRTAGATFYIFKSRVSFLIGARDISSQRPCVRTHPMLAPLLVLDLDLLGGDTLLPPFPLRRQQQVLSVKASLCCQRGIGHRKNPSR